MLRDGEGCLVATEDLEDFATKTLRLLQDPSFRQALGRSAIAYANRWQARGMAQRMIDLYQHTLQLKPALKEAVSPIID